MDEPIHKQAREEATPRRSALKAFSRIGLYIPMLLGLIYVITHYAFHWW